MRSSASFAIILVVLSVISVTLAGVATAQPATIGEHVTESLASPHPYPNGSGQQPELVWSDSIYHPGAEYIAPHFSKFDLAKGHWVVIRSEDSSQYWTYTGLGKRNLGLSEKGFFAVHIKGDTAIIELWADEGEPGYGYDIDLYGRGYNYDEIAAFWAAGLAEEMNLVELPDFNKSICTTNDSDEAKCYLDSEPAIYDRARAVTRLLLNGSSWCTGWLIGCDGHVMTNEHCIGSQSQLDDIDFEWMAEGADCATDCTSSLACPGTIEASGGTLVQLDAGLDYSLVIPDTSIGGNTDLNAEYGYLQLRGSGPELDERIYIPHHPAGWGKHITVESTYPLEPNPPFASVVSTTEKTCSGAPPEGDTGYWADTQGGSSGSPVLGYADHRVVALHHCRGSGFCTSGSAPPDDPNRGVPIDAVIADLGENLPSCATCIPPEPPTNLAAVASGDNQIDLTWTAVVGADSYSIYRAEGRCPQSNYELIASGVVPTSYSDTTVSGGSSYAYQVSAFDASEGCDSFRSNCSGATATGACTLTPTFDGLNSAGSAGVGACAIDLEWKAASARCGASVVYNVWRSPTPDFDPDLSSPLATCLTGTEYSDYGVDFGTDYYYQVRAEDDSGNGAGPCAGGNQDNNSTELSAVAAGAETAAFDDDIESGPASWTLTTGPEDEGTSPWSIVGTQSNSPTQSWFVSDEPDVKDQRLETASPIVMTAGGSLSFWHWFDSETNWDGAVLEYSTDGGSTWHDILDGDGSDVPANGDRFVAGGYTGPLNSSSSPIGGRAAWHGSSGAFIETIVDLTDFSGETVDFRWRFGCDGSVGGTGWWVDDVRVTYGSSCESGGLFADSFETGDDSRWDEK